MSVSSPTQCAWGVYVYSLANIKLDLPASSRGSGSWPEYQVGGGSVMVVPGGLTNMVCMWVKYVSVHVAANFKLERPGIGRGCWADKVATPVL